MRWGTVAVVVALCGYFWLVVLSPPHFGQDVLVKFGPGRGVEERDVPALMFLVLGLAGVWRMRRR